MDKELISTETHIKNEAKYFLQYLEKITVAEIIDFIESLSQFSDIYIFSGVIRNFFIQYNEKARDIDIVYQGDDLALNNFLKNYDFRINSFNGYKINLAGFTIDLWKVESTWAIKNEKIRWELFDAYVLPKSTFFNFSSIIFDYKAQSFLFTNDFTNFLDTNILDLVLEENPLPQLCILNTIYYKEKFNLKISERLKQFCVDNFNHYSNEDFNKIQIKHFSEIKYSYSDLEEFINIFKKTNSLLEQLNLFQKEELFYFDDLFKESTDFLNSRAKQSLIDLSPTAFFCIKGEPLILFFENYRDSDKQEEIEIQIWNFNQSPIIFINDGKQWIIKNGFKLLNSRTGLDVIKNSNLKDFDYFEIITGKTWDKFQKQFKQENRVDYFLLNNISEFRKKLILDYNLNSKIANSLIGRSIFIRYLIDREINLDKYKIKNQNDFHNILAEKEDCYKLFTEILEDFGDNLFPLKYKIDEEIISENEFVTNEHLSILIALLKGGKLLKDSTILSLFNLYDFSIIPIEFISNIYERFIGAENQAIKGAYYTPLFLVDYIEKETVKLFFNNNNETFNCKVLDPACGSGVFLVETLRLIINQYKKINPSYKDSEDNYKKYKIDLINLLTANIFGIDKDENAVSVAIFSLYITLLDNLVPKSIKDFKLPTLVNKNFFVADFFDLNHDFNIKLKKHSFEFILGNPPWKTKHAKEKQLFEKYVENRKRKEGSNLEIDNREIAEAFLVRVSDFNFNEAALIVVSKILYKISRKNKKGIFRNYLLNNFSLRKIIELSSVRHQIFNQSSDSAIAPATIIFYKKQSDENLLRENIIKHISLKPNIFFEVFKLMIIEKYDIKEITQGFLIDEDWIWKVLVYGNILDYQFIKRFKSTKSIYDYINNEKNFLFGKGIIVNGGDENKILDHKKIDHSIISKQKGLTPFNIEYSANFLKNLQYVHRPRKLSLFKAPVLLVGKGITSEFRAKAAISSIDVIYTDAITGIKPLNDYAKNIIYTLESLFNSDFFSYFLLQTNSSIGIEREQSHDKDDKFSIPLIIDENGVLKTYSEELKLLFSQRNARDFSDYESQDLEKQILKVEKQINNFLNKLYNISPSEKALISYANDVTIPLLKGSIESKRKLIGKIKYKENFLENYADIFNDHFSKRFKSDGNYFETEILWSEFTILMKFKIIPTPSTSINAIQWSKNDNNELLTFLIKLGFEKLSENLYLQKDIKGFEDDFFYIAKPNQYKSWHTALAYLDLAEFIEAFFKLDNGEYIKNEN
ncbi:MAG: SAM-dependent methyltransferase [Chryseobacterium sp.]|uniref:N-6 DNA methylase n=1 Tax=Chryseobacterium sp. TaxID=1871047 RepID=UPI0025C456EC|nr:N-6 DNA methylase [Chryseobacterium sp.]MCJ7934749.1 SAM-dependent methyltransferase [Chryseobacterium sp.]